MGRRRGASGLIQHAECIGTAPNNEAEYRALIAGLTAGARFNKGRVRCVSDSELMVKQLTGAYRTKGARLRELQAEVRGVEAAFSEVTYTRSPRTEPQIARVDGLVNAALDVADRGVHRSATDSSRFLGGSTAATPGTKAWRR
jgi:ribonuclease HI